MDKKAQRDENNRNVVKEADRIEETVADRIQKNMRRREHLKLVAENKAKNNRAQKGAELDPNMPRPEFNGLSINDIKREFDPDKITEELIKERSAELAVKVREYFEKTEDETPEYHYDFDAPPPGAIYKAKNVGDKHKEFRDQSFSDFHKYGINVCEEVGGLRYGLYHLGDKKTSNNYIIKFTGGLGGAKGILLPDSIPDPGLQE